MADGPLDNLGDGDDQPWALEKTQEDILDQLSKHLQHDTQKSLPKLKQIAKNTKLLYDNNVEILNETIPHDHSSR